jgi:hypothetical protein
VGSGVVSMWLMLGVWRCSRARAQIYKLKGVNAPELRAQVDFLLSLDFWWCEAFSRLTRTCHWLPSISVVSTEPILFVRRWGALFGKSQQDQGRPVAGDISLAQKALRREVEGPN